MTLSIGLILIGLLLLILGGDWLIRGSVSIAQRLRLTPMVIGLTVVSFGTSAPEFLVSLQSALSGNAGIALGNVIGSNIANIALILGATALFCPIPVRGSTLKIDAPFLIIVSVILTLICHFTASLTRLQGIIGMFLLTAYVAGLVRAARAQTQQAVTAEAPESAEAAPPPSLLKAILCLLIAIAALKWGAEWLVQGASAVAASLGVSSRIIGLTVVAIGTSLPELFASIIAARRGNVDMAVGNAIGSNLFNILCVLAASCSICPIHHIDPAFTRDCLWMIGLSLLIWLQLRTGYTLTRTEGGILLLVYFIYIFLTL